MVSPTAGLSQKFAQLWDEGIGGKEEYEMRLEGCKKKLQVTKETSLGIDRSVDLGFYTISEKHKVFFASGQLKIRIQQVLSQAHNPYIIQYSDWLL